MSADVPVTVAAVRAVARDVLALELRHANGQPLPGASAGAHIDLALPNGLVRQYSLVNATGQATMDCYQVAVGWDANSRGGSVWIHEKLKVGQALRVTHRATCSEMAPEHRRVLLLAGGIGVTPIYAMAQACAQQGVDVELWASARSAPRLAYLEELKALLGQRLHLHADDEQGGPMNLTERLATQRWDAVYACGPAPMLDALTAATAHWAPGSVRMERFKGAEQPASERQPFELVLQRAGLSTTVDAHESVLDAMERVGVDFPWSCREGICGTCEAPVLEGEVQHLDYVLSPEERAEQRRMMVCVSRCGGGRLVLDI
uniref:Toluene-4-sulfonate monooxygenase system reductase subunit TsaB1 n=1 Tax=Comamonas testosteroni TaxID=285 RepID=TSAB1_COMTE|nr:RecName: Full=Toluene-4-sulfonate monooxygenase system reductase subunit TsaB1; AltName: Full=TS methylmonooxygenase system, reductase B; AltName: Full=Toluenesulfonate methyl-monooxygenase reductase component TsaB1 [Comamonas testosteroni]AAC44805.1 toluenesulfonate methyl-monooxygenase reductase component TsaB [Comamonas testosteroni]